jgi:hypothetical protein
MKTAGKAAIYSVLVVLFVIGSWLLIKNHPEVQFAFYLPAAVMLIYTVIRDDLFTKPSNVRHANANVKGK